MEERVLALALKVVAWLKYPMVLVMAVVLVHPPKVLLQHTESLATIGSARDVLTITASNATRNTERQSDMNEADIKSLQRRLDLLEALRIDASIAAMKATIDYDHALLMTIAGMLVLMAIGNALSHFKRRSLDAKESP